MTILTAPSQATQTTTRMSGGFANGSLAAGSTAADTISMGGCPLPCSVSVTPGTGATVQVQYSIDGGNTFTDWDNGDVTAYSVDVLSAPVSQLKFSCTVAGTTASTWGVA